jgi:hypothetical protein
MREIAKNDITGRYIKSLPPNQVFRNGWDEIFAKKSGAEWHKEICPDVVIKSFEGFSDIDYDETLINKAEFNRRLIECVIS